MLCVPAPRLALLQVAVLVLVAPVGSVTALQPEIAAPPSVKAAVPVGAVPVTVAVKVTLVPSIDGSAELASAVLLLLLAGLTPCAKVALVDALLPLSPP